MKTPSNNRLIVLWSTSQVSPYPPASPPENRKKSKTAKRKRKSIIKN